MVLMLATMGSNHEMKVSQTQIHLSLYLTYACQIGFYCPGDCSFYYCEPGSYSDQLSQKECTLSPINTYVGEINATEYIPCDEGDYAAIGSSE